MRKKLFGILFILIIVALGGGKFLIEHTIENSNRVLYENKNLGIGFHIPEDYKKNPFEVEEEIQENGVVIRFLDPESGALVFSMYYLDKDYWDEEVKENFSVPYSEVYKDDSSILLCVNVSDVQYDVNDVEQREKYFELWELKDEVCASLYFIES